MSNSANLGLPFIEAAQAQKHVTHNEALKALDTVVQLAVLDRDFTAAPGSPANGDRYIVAAGATGSWSGKDGEIAAFQDGAWVFYAPREGWLAWVADEDKLVAWGGSTWGEVSGGGGSVNPTPLVGVNATADTTNRLSVSSPASLFNHEGAGHQLKINKNLAADTASMLFQTGFSGRAEMGLTGDDDYHFKVSSDGSIWNEAIIINRTTGAVTFPNTTGGGGGEANTASNIGTGGVGLFKDKSGVDLRFKKLNAGDGTISVTDDVANNEVDLKVAASSIGATQLADNAYVAADKAKVDFLSVTQAVNLDAIEIRVNELDAAVILQGTWNASAGTFPGGGAAQAGHSYIVSVAGTVNGVPFALNDRIIAITDNASTTIFAGNWHKADYSDQVVTVFGRNGAVAAQAGDYTALKITNVPAGNIVATNVQAALNELDGEKAALAHGHTLADISDSGALAGLNTVAAAQIDANAVTLAKLDHGTQGDILYYGATGTPTRLGFGTAGQFLKTQGTGANPVWASVGGGGDLLAANNLSDVASAPTSRTNLGLAIGTNVQAFDADILKADTADVLTAGFAATVFDNGTQTTGTLTPNEASGNVQKAVNGGAHTLAPPVNDGTIIIQYTNNATAGPLTTSGFSTVDGDAVTTVNLDDFFFFIVKANGFSSLTVKALQ